MSYEMKLPTIGLSLAVCSLVAGCAAGIDSKPVDYKTLPGSGDQMAQGPGLFKVGDGADYDDGVRVYSNDPTHDALIKSSDTKTQNPSNPASTRHTSKEQAAAAQQQDYREFQEFEQYKRFQKMPKDSAEYQRFKDWQEWKRYQQWREGDSANP
jgi:hypothetical protein